MANLVNEAALLAGRANKSEVGACCAVLTAYILLTHAVVFAASKSNVSFTKRCIWLPSTE